MIKEGQTVHRTEVIDKSDKHKNILKISQTNLQTEQEQEQEAETDMHGTYIRR